MRILVIDDDPVQRAWMRQYIDATGDEMIEAGTLGEAYDAVADRNNLPDVAVVDLVLPDGNGEQFIEHVRRNGMPIKIIIASAAADDRRKECHPLGVPLVEKPIAPRKLDYLLKT